MSHRHIKFLNLFDPRDDIVAAANRVIASGRYVSGVQVERFERHWASYCQAEEAVMCASGGAAITLALRALHAPPGARVVVPALTFAATGMAVLSAGAQPVYCDVDERGLMDVPDAAQVAEDTRAWGIIPVHLYGQTVDMQHVMKIADDLRLNVIEDACQAHGAIDGVQGNAACFSFYPSKNLGAFGEGGAVVTNNRFLALTIRSLANYGVPEGRKYHHLLLGENLRMDELQAEVLLAKLPYLAETNKKRSAVAKWYREEGVDSFVTSGNYHLYPVKVDAVEPILIRNMLQERGIETGQHYPYVLPELVPLFQPGNWPVAVDIARHHITLPMGPHLNREDVAYIAEQFLKVTGRNKED